jgi:hypothetical protein
MPLSPIPSTLPTSTYEHLVLEALNEIAVGSTINYNPPILDTALFRHLVLNALQYIANNPSGGGGVTSISAGTTGLTPATATTGAVTLAGTLAITNGGTGATTAANALTALGAVASVPTDASYVKTIRTLTSIEYDALGSIDPNTIYFII